MSFFNSDPFTTTLPGGLTYKPRNYREPLPQDQAASVMQSLTGHTTSALQTGLEILDKPGRAVRGLLGGKPREIGNLLPFSDTLGVTRPEDRVSGRQLMDNLGASRRGDKGWGAAGLGIAAEIATDPLIYLTLGSSHALTGSGKALQASGSLRGWSRAAKLQGFHDLESTLSASGHSASDIAHLRNQGYRIASPADEAAVAAAGHSLAANQPLGALAGFGLPFKSPSLLVGKGGPVATKIAEGLDTAGDALKYGNPIGRWANALFDPAVREATGEASQRAAAQYGSPALDAARVQGRDDLHQVVSRIDDALNQGAPEEELVRFARQTAEGVPMRPLDPTNPFVNTNAQRIGPQIGQFAKDIEKRQLDESIQLGLPLQDAGDEFIDYFPRQGIDLDAARSVASGNPARSRTGPQVFDRNLLPTATGANFYRDELFRGIPGGSEMINDLVRRHGGDALQVGIPGIRRDVLREMVGELRSTGIPITRPVIRQLGQKADLLAPKLAGLTDDYSKHGVGLYSPNIAGDVQRSAEQHARTVASAKTVYGFIGENARHRSSLASDAVPISQIFRGLRPQERLGFVTRLADQTAGTPMSGALVEAARALARQGAQNVDPLLMGKLKDLRNVVDQYAIPRKLYDELVQSHGQWSRPEVLKSSLGAFDGLTSAFKNLAYPIWPASHVRNAFSAGLNNAFAGTNLSDHVLNFRVMRGTATADELRRVVPEIPMGVTDQAARDIVRRQQFANGKVFDGHSGQFDLDNAVAAKLNSTVPGRITPDLWGANRTGGGSFAQDTGALIGGGIKDTARELLEKIRHPFSAPSPIRQTGVFGGTSDFPLLSTGRQVGSNVEDFFRGANYLGNRRLGMAAKEAGQSVRDLHFDYDALSKFEKNVMRRVVPFYTFARKNLPLQVNRLTSAPASVIGQMRLMQAGRDPKEYVPDYLAGGAAIPTGPEVDGHRQFVSSLGTPLEEALERWKFKGGLPDLTGTAMAVGGSVNPLIKAPLEQLFNTQLHTGRKLSDLRPSTTATAIGGLLNEENPQLLSQFLVNTPLTRFISSLDKLSDSRKSVGVKALNMTTGLRVTDVDLDRERGIEAKREAEAFLARSPRLRSFTNWSPRPGMEVDLSDRELTALRVLANIRADGQERAAEKAKAERGRIFIRPAP